MVASSVAVAGIERGRACRDHRPVGSREARGLGLDELVAALGRLDRAALGEDLRPGLARDLQEPERELPVLVEPLGHQLVEAPPRHLAGRHVVHQPRQIIGKRKGSGGRIGDERCAACAAHVGRSRPSQHKLREEEPAFERTQRRRQLQRAQRERAGRRLGEHEFVLVHVADRENARQNGCIGVEHFEKHITREPAGAARREEQRGVRERERITRGREAGDDLAGQQRLDQHRQEGR